VLFPHDRRGNALQRHSAVELQYYLPYGFGMEPTLFTPVLWLSRVIGRAMDPTTKLQGRDVLAELVVESSAELERHPLV